MSLNSLGLQALAIPYSGGKTLKFADVRAFSAIITYGVCCQLCYHVFNEGQEVNASAQIPLPLFFQLGGLFLFFASLCVYVGENPCFTASLRSLFLDDITLLTAIAADQRGSLHSCRFPHSLHLEADLAFRLA